MPKYVVLRTVGEVSEEEIEAVAQRSIEALEEMPECAGSAPTTPPGKARSTANTKLQARKRSSIMLGRPGYHLTEPR